MPSVSGNAEDRPGSFARLVVFTYVRADAHEAVVEVMPLLEPTSGWAVHVVLPEAMAAPHFELTIQYLNAAVPGIMLTCVGRTTKSGRRIAATEAEVFQNGKVIARAMRSHVVL